MKRYVFAAWGLSLLASASAYTLSSSSKVTPVQKVLEMMGEMKVESEKMKEEESSTFAKYAEWTDDQQRELGFEIKSGKSEIEKLTAFIEQADNDVIKLGKEIESIDKDMAGMEAEMKEATELRKKENTIFVETEEDLSESVDATQKAAEVIEAGAQDKEEAMMLLQRMATKVPKMPLVLAAFLEEDEVGAPSVAAYKSQSGGVLEMLEKLNKKFKKELDEVTLEETNRAHNYEMEMQHWTDTITALKADLSEKKAEKGKTKAESAKAKGELVKTKAELKEDEKMLAEVTATFAAKKSLFEDNQKTREEEIEAINKAIEIISSPAVSDGYSDNIDHRDRAQTVSLLQTQSSTKRVAVKERVSQLLKRKAALLSSSTLKAFAGEVANSPFAKVIDMIKALITKLKEEAAAEAEHKEWCDEQLKENKLARDKHGTKVDKLTATLEELTSKIDAMAKEIETLSAEQAELTKAQKKATEVREEEKAKNTDAIKDAVAGAAATKQAIEVLEKFYESQSFIQQVPEMEEYKGQQGGAKGIVGMLEVIESDFNRLKAETTAEEMQAKKEYDSFMEESTKNNEAKHKKEVKLKLDKDQLEFEHNQASKDLKLSQEKLDKANDYYAELKPTCLEVHVSFEERMARRKEEIKALKEAYGILDEKSED